MTGLSNADQELVVRFRDSCAIVQLPLSVIEQEMVERVRDDLSSSPDYKGKVKQWFDLLIVRLCKFLTSRANLSAIKRRFTYLAEVALDRQELPHESELQLDLFDYLQSAMASVLLEVPYIAAGRTDIYLPMDRFRFIIEVKRATAMSWSRYSIRPHSIQASAYSVGDVRLGVLATLDLSKRPPGTPHVSECFGVVRQRMSSTDVRAVVFMRVAGNRTPPSSASS
jgi:hypothetical protein